MKVTPDYLAQFNYIHFAMLLSVSFSSRCFCSINLAKLALSFPIFFYFWRKGMRLGNLFLWFKQDFKRSVKLTEGVGLKPSAILCHLKPSLASWLWIFLLYFCIWNSAFVFENVCIHWIATELQTSICCLWLIQIPLFWKSFWEDC